MFWDKRGREMTQETIELALSKGKELKIDSFVVASSTGYTAGMLTGKGLNVVCVRSHAGFKEEGKQIMEDKDAIELESRGVKILTATHLMGGIERGIENNFGGSTYSSIVASTFKMFGQGTKVAVEIAVMALDAGLIPFGREIISIGGSGRGADTALVIQPSHAKNFFQGAIKEIICKPRDF